MNKIIMGLIVAVCVLGMALIMLNEKLGRKPEPAPVSVETPSSGPVSGSPDSAALPSGRSAADDLMTSLPAPSPSPAPALTPSPAPMAPAPEPSAAPAFSFGGETDTPPATLPPLPQTTPPLPAPAPEKTPEAEAPLTPATTPSTPPLPDEERKDVPVPSLASSVVAAHERDMASPAPAYDKTPEKATPAPTPAKKESNIDTDKPRKAETPRTESRKEETRKEEARKKETPRKEAAPAREKDSADRNIDRFVVYARDGGATVRIVGNATISYKPMVLTGPDRVVVDLDGDWDIKAPGIPKNELVTNIRIGKLNGKTRVVIDLNSSAKTRYTLSKDRRMLDVRVDK
ncbi:MAG: AMIN domain-containing protein [Desulfovibrio sp.]|uniref:AMIN domain-containing protein n=1 Tax=Desulfovibrio sp. TaxID=885 RepID=UPI0025C625AA|nr:AMIN domain-containing protein [Desulfovibrio sp.]MCI7568717.1 AMIN domain-containing protein [Desulfovibrio sp.]